MLQDFGAAVAGWLFEELYGEGVFVGFVVSGFDADEDCEDEPEDEDERCQNDADEDDDKQPAINPARVIVI
jgi:hypothetical protein